MRILQGLLLFVAVAAAADLPSISLPGTDWAVRSDAQGFRVKVNDTRPEGRRYLFAEGPAGVALSITLERVNEPATAEGCRQAFRGRVKRATFRLTGVKEGEAGPFATLEYMIEEHQGVALRQKNVFGCMPHGNAYIDVHVSKAGFQERDQALLSSALDSVRIVERPEALALMAEGSRRYLKREYQEAIPLYQRALDLEKKERKLELSLWRVLVDNLAMAYGITGDLKRAEETLRYGVSQDPEYPMFYYNLACTFGERGELQGVLENLQLVLERKANMIPGEKLPDPRTDSSFRRFLDDPEFRKVAARF